MAVCDVKRFWRKNILAVCGVKRFWEFYTSVNDLNKQKSLEILTQNVPVI